MVKHIHIQARFYLRADMLYLRLFYFQEEGVPFEETELYPRNLDSAGRWHH